MDLLVRGAYLTLEHLTRGARLNAEAIEARVREYGRTVTQPPAGWFAEAEVVPTDGQGAVHVTVPLWTQEEGRSDLSIELLLTPLAADAYAIELLDIHVL